MRHQKKPEIRKARIGACNEYDVLTHPAFGVITMTTPRGGGIGKLFGSDIEHSECVSIEIKRAELHRNLSNDSVFGRATVATIEMSHAQFAQFITSNGNGSGTPCTIRHSAPVGSELEMVPGIEAIETKNETFRREVEKSGRERLEAIEARIAELGAMIEEGKVGKKGLRLIHAELKRHVEQLPGSIGFVLGQAEEALEKATSHAKIEVEAYIDNAARRHGLESIRKIGLLENKDE